MLPLIIRSTRELLEHYSTSLQIVQTSSSLHVCVLDSRLIQRCLILWPSSKSCDISKKRGTSEFGTQQMKVSFFNPILTQTLQDCNLIEKAPLVVVNFLGGRLVRLSSKIQNCIALSTTEVEYIAAH